MISTCHASFKMYWRTISSMSLCFASINHCYRSKLKESESKQIAIAQLAKEILEKDKDKDQRLSALGEENLQQSRVCFCVLSPIFSLIPKSICDILSSFIFIFLILSFRNLCTFFKIVIVVSHNYNGVCSLSISKGIKF